MLRPTDKWINRSACYICSFFFSIKSGCHDSPDNLLSHDIHLDPATQPGVNEVRGNMDLLFIKMLLLNGVIKTVEISSRRFDV